MPDLEPDTVSALEAPNSRPPNSSDGSRGGAYMHAFRGKTFVVAFGGELVQAGALNWCRICRCCPRWASARCWCTARVRRSMSSCAEGLYPAVRSRPVAHRRRRAGMRQGSRRRDPPGHRGPRSARACPTRPCRTRIRVISTLRHGPPHRRAGRRGLQRTGQVRKIDVDALKFAIEGFVGGAAVAAGFLAHGRRLQLRWKTQPPAWPWRCAPKLIFLSSSHGVLNDDSTPTPSWRAWTPTRCWPPARWTRTSCFPAIRLAGGQARRGPLAPAAFSLDGSVLLEIFTHDGVGTVVVEDTLDDLRPATIDDVGAILSLIEAAGSRRHAGAAPAQRDRARRRELHRAGARRRDLRLRTLLRRGADGREWPA